jgi:hypothetical protein
MSKTIGFRLVLSLATLAACADDQSDARARTLDSPLLESAAAAPAAPRIKSARAFGTGCPASSYHVDISADRSTLRIGFADYVLERMPSGPSLQTRNCSIVLEVEPPPNTSVAIGALSLSGYAAQTASVSSTVSSYYGFVGGTGVPATPRTGPELPEFSHVREGENDDEFVLRDQVPPDRLIFSECGRPVSATIDTRLVLRDRGRGRGYVSLNSIGGLEMITRPCACPDAGIVDAGPLGASDGGLPARDAGSMDAAFPDSGSASSEPRVLITRATAIGSLCPPGSLEGVVVDGGTDVVFTRNPAPPMTADVPPFVTGGCVASVRVTPPPGHKLTVDGFDARAQVALEPGTRVSLGASFWFGGSSSAQQESQQKATVVGPTGEFPFRSDFRADEIRSYSGCGRPALLNLRLTAALVETPKTSRNEVQIERISDLKIRLEQCGD